MCQGGEAHVEVDGFPVDVERFLDEDRDADGFPTMGLYKTPAGDEVVFRVADEKLGKHTGAGETRCRGCCEAKARRAKTHRRRRKERAKRPRRRRARAPRPPAAQGAFAFAA